MHSPAVAEPDLVLGGVHIDVDLGRVELQVEHKCGVAAVVEHVAVGLLHGVGHQPVADDPAVDKKVLQVRLAAGKGRQAHPAPQPQARQVSFDIQCLLHKRRAAHRGNPALALRLAVTGLEIVQHPAVVAQAEGDIEARQGEALYHLLQVIELGFLGAQELAPGRRVEKQVAHFHRGATGVGRRLQLHLHLAALAGGGAALAAVFRGVAGQGQAGHGADTGQGLPAKAQAAHLLQVFQRGDLAGGVTRQRQGQVIRRNATAVVPDANQFDAAGLHVDIHPGGARIEAVFQHLLDHGGGALDHFTGGNLVRQPGTEKVNTGHSGLYIR